MCVSTSQYISGVIIYGSCCVKAREFSSSSSSLPSETPKMEFVLKKCPFLPQKPYYGTQSDYYEMQLAIVHGSGDLARIVGVCPSATFTERPLETRKGQTLKQTAAKQTKTTHPRRHCQCHVCSPPCPHFGFILPCQVATLKYLICL